MTIELIETNKVMSSIQDGKTLVCVNFKDEAYLDCKTMTIEALQERMNDGNCLFFSKSE